MKWKNKGHEYDNLKRDIISHNCGFYIWGYGTFGITFYNEFKNDMKIKGFIDSNPAKWTDKVIDGLAVLSPEQFNLLRKEEKVLVSTGFTKAVYDILNRWGYVRFQDYYHIDEWAAYYRLVKNNIVFANDIFLGITSKCTLNCEYCSAFIPKRTNPRDLPFDDIKGSLGQYFNWVDKVNVLGLVGGDAMMHRDFSDILQYVGDNYYPERINNLEVYSNAIIPLSDGTISLFKKYNVIYRFTDYSACTDRQRITQTLEQLKQAGIRYDHAKFQRWYDPGYPQESNGITSEEGLINFCTACDRKSCHSLYLGKIFYCGMCLSAASIGYCEYDKTDYFDLNNTEDSKEVFLEYYLGYSEKGYYNYCRKCNGGQNVNTHYIDSGKQISKG